MRRQVEDRIIFTKEQKDVILSKTSCKCARCGQLLTIDSMTVEHIVPLSKGGTNDIKNLVSLCYDCNQNKGNYILHPLDYYPYVNKEYTHEIVELFSTYLDEIPWYGRRNYTKEDKKLFYYNTNKFGQIKKLKNGDYLANCFRNSITFERVYSDEFDDVYAFVKDYNNRYNIPSDTLESYLNEIFNKGCIYKLCSKSSTIAILPFSVESWTNSNDIKVYKLQLHGIPNKYQKQEYAKVIIDAITYVLDCLSELNYLYATSCVLSIPNDDSYACLIASSLRGTVVAESDDWKYYVVQFIAAKGEDKESSKFLYEQSISRDSYKIDEVISDGLERRLHLPSLQKKQEKIEQNKTNKEKLFNKKKSSKNKHTKRQYDEYDIEYYK